MYSKHSSSYFTWRLRMNRESEIPWLITVTRTGYSLYVSRMNGRFSFDHLLRNSKSRFLSIWHALTVGYDFFHFIYILTRA
jgi:hypothetical protein